MDAGVISRATTQLFDILLQEDAPARILDSLARIVGETLGVDRSLIYDISLSRDEAACLTEWLNPERPEITTTKANYPLSLFRQAATLVFETQDKLESHARAPHPAMIADNSAAILHEAMSIASLLWYPFAFRSDGFYLLVFNHVTSHHEWQPAELDFMRSATRHVSMALMKIELIRERARAEEAFYAAQKLESLGLLAGGVAHDFNNLMVGVVTSADLLSRRLPSDSPLQELAAQILHSGQRAAALASQLLAYAGKGQPGVEPLDLGQIVKGTLLLVRSSLGRVSVEVAASKVPAIDANASQLEQVVMNLVVNAAEAMADRAGVIRIAIDDVEIDASTAGAYESPLTPVSPGRYVRLRVSDQGPGIDDETRKRIFDPFFSTKRQGRGLGLSAVLGIVKHHRGGLRIASASGAGTTFEVLWPASRQASELPGRSEAARAVHTGTVLCIDDDPSVVRAIEQVLVAEGYDVLSAHSGALGISLFDDRMDQIDGVILDLSMPPPAGREVLRYIRAARPAMPVVLISGFTSDSTIRDALDPITRFVAKPFLANELLIALRDVTADRA